MAIAAGASAVGLVSRMPSGPGVVPDATIAEIAARVPPGVDSFLLTALRDANTIIEQHRAARTSALQLVDHLPVAVHTELREALPGVRLVQVIHVTGPESVDQALAVEATVDAILLDSGNPAAEVPELGGTGRRHDWSLSARIRNAVSLPVYLAGGLHPDNVAEAIATVRPFAVDVCSGLRDSRFALESTKLTRFADAIATAG